MTIEAKVIAHSSSEGSPDLISLALRYPRFIHAELMTHRVFSRSASSSRAVPIWRMIRDVLRDPARPVAWGSNKPGMQAGRGLTGLRLWIVQSIWMLGCYLAVALAWVAMKAGAHKQIVNRILEPWAHISVIVTATDWENFFSLRCHPAADPTMRALAEAMEDAIFRSTAKPLGWLEWHQPYAEDGSAEQSAARCARVSYLRHDGTAPSIEDDERLASTLLTERHMSPFEHQATPTPGERHHNLRGWMSQRAMMENTKCL